MIKVSPDLARVREAIAARGCRLGDPVHLLVETASTNDDAKAGAREGAPHGSLWIAETQSRGRGRQGRVWISPPGENLLFSVLLRIACTPQRVPLISLATGLAVRDAVAKALDAHADARVLVKWPNDVVVRGADADGNEVLQKIAGILVESSLSGTKVEHVVPVVGCAPKPPREGLRRSASLHDVVVGVGVNVHTRLFPEELTSTENGGSVLRPTSLALEGASNADRAELLADILAGLDCDVEHVVQRGLGLIHARLSAHDALAGKEVESDGDGDNAVRGIACGMDLDGRLIVRRPDGVSIKMTSGEVRLRVRPHPPSQART